LALLYNPVLLKAAGVAVPRTWADLVADEPKLAAVGAQTLNAAAAGEWLLPWVYGDGGSLADADAKTIEVNQPAPVTGLTQRLELQASGVAVADPSPNSVTAMETAFRDSQVAMIMDYSSALPLLVGGPAFTRTSQVGIAPVPAGTVKASGPIFTWEYGVWAGSSNLSTAYQFVDYAQSPAMQALLAEQVGLLPTRAAAYQVPAVRANPVVSAFGPVIASGTALPQVQNQGALLGPLNDGFRSALAGKDTPQGVLDGVAESYLSVLTGFTIAPTPTPSPTLPAAGTTSPPPATTAP
jgi:arabinogalactan oligomer / maltooligosaccharide transport system substrate-binding protein